MTIGQIKRIIEEMITDLKFKLSLASGNYDFYISYDKDMALENAHSAFLLYRKINELKSIKIDYLDIDTLQRIEEYITLLRKEDYFKSDEIDAFIKIVRG